MSENNPNGGDFETYRPYQAQPGIGHVGSYQVAGIPYITGALTIPSGSEEKIEFPRVTQEVTIINRGGDNQDLQVHFAPFEQDNVGSGLHTITLDDKFDAITLKVRCKEIYIRNSEANGGAYTVIAELTNIMAREMFTLTGSGLTDAS